MRLRLLTWLELCIDIGEGSVERAEFRIVDFRNINAKPAVNSDDKVQEIHGINIDRLAQIRGRIDACDIGFRSDVVEFLLNHLADIDCAHSLSGSIKSLPISAKNNAPAWPSLTRWSAESVMAITERGPMAPSTTQGRVTALPKPTIATCGG